MLEFGDMNKFNRWIHLVSEIFVSKRKVTSKKIVYIDAYRPDSLNIFLPRILYAKGIEKCTGVDKIIILTTEINQEMEDICKAFGVEVKKIQSIWVFLKAMLLSCYWYIFCNTESKVYSLKILNEEVGIYLADFVIRHSNDLYTFDKIRLKDLKKVILFTYRILSVGSIFKLNPPNMYIVHETGYWFGPIIKIAERKGAEIIQCDAGNRINFLGDKHNLPIVATDIWHHEIKKLMESANEVEWLLWADTYFENRRRGLTDRDAGLAYANKINITKEIWMKSAKADKCKKNIVIMAHCFSDDANISSVKAIYRDYYDWLVNTLKIIQNIDNVNWLLKAHPARKVYNEGDEIYSIFEKYAQKKNIFIIEDTISSNALYGIIDAAVTVSGTCGLEFSSSGIPVICAGWATYGGFGFTMEPKNEKEYIELLSHLDNISPLSNEKVNMAKKVSYAYFNVHNPIDKFDEIFVNSFSYNPKEADDYIVNELLNMSTNGQDLKESWFYKRGLNFIEEAKSNA